MPKIRASLVRFRRLFDKRGLAAELESRIQFHIEDNLRAGVSPEEARRQALIALGGLDQTKESVRARRGFPWLDSLLQDTRFALRMLRKNPGFATVAVLTLAVAIGANATVFIIADAILFKNLPFADSERVLYVSSVNRETGYGRGVSYPDYRYLQSRTRSFEGLAAFSGDDTDVSDNGAVPTQVRGALFTTNAFSVIGQKPLVGREFLPEDERPGAAPVVILAHDLWQSRYGASPSIIGKTIRVNDVPRTVIGVMPSGFRFPRSTELWMPLIDAGNWQRREYRQLTVFGRLATGANLSSAVAELRTLAHILEVDYPDTNAGIGIQAQTYNDYFTSRNTRLIFLALLGAVGFVLLIACANVANLLLARASARVREVSIRVALGAGRSRVIRQLLIESLCLSALGGMLGTLLGIWGVQVFRANLNPDDSHAYLSFAIDYRVLAFLVSMTILTGVMFGLAPALRLSNPNINFALKEGGHATGTSVRARSLSNVLVMGEIALTFVLLVGAGLMIRSFLNMTRTPIGADTHNILSMDIILRAAKYPTDASQLSFHEQLKARLLALPGIEAVALASNFPGDGWTDFVYELEGRPVVDPRGLSRIGGVVVSPSYFPMLNIRLIRGRLFTQQDNATGIPVVLVNKSFAAMAWPRSDPLGRRLRLYMPPTNSPNAPVSVPQAWLTVIGVVPDVVQSDSSEGAHDPLIYLPYTQLPQREMVVAARTALPPATLMGLFRREVVAMDPDLPVTDLRTLDTLLEERAWSWRIYGSMFSIFAAIALLLATVGVYAVITQSVSHRNREIGIRVALGASPHRILAMIFEEALLQFSIGLILGLIASLGLVQILSGLLVGVEPLDPITFFGVALLLGLAAALGCAIPARRAMRIDPVSAMRCE